MASRSGGATGFSNAPVTKALIAITGISSIAVHVFSIKSESYRWTIQSLLSGRLDKMLLTQLPFTTPVELFCGLFTLYLCRVLERQRGSAKYSVFVVSSFALSAFFQTLFLLPFKDKYLCSGPYGYIFAALVFYFRDIPVTLRFRVFGLQLTDKFFPYLGFFQLATSFGHRSLLSALAGLLAGAVFSWDFFGITRWIFPRRVVSVASTVFAPLIGTTSRPTSTGAMGGGGGGGASNGATTTATAPSTTTAAPRRPMRDTHVLAHDDDDDDDDGSIGEDVPLNNASHNNNNANNAREIEVNQAHLETLMQMGFDRDVCIAELRRTGNDLETSLNHLLAAL